MTTATVERKRAKSGSFTLDYTAFSRAVRTASHAVPTRSPTAALSCVCIGDGLVSGQASGEFRIDVEMIDASFSPVLLPQKRLLAILNSSPGCSVTLRPEESACVVKIGRSEWRLPTEDASQFPAWEPNGLSQMPLLPEDEFLRAVRHVLYAIDNDSSRFALGGVFVESIGDKIHFVGTDGRRLSVATCSHDAATDEFVLFPKDGQKAAPVIPPKPLARLMAECTSDSRSVSMEVGNGVIKASIGDVTVTAATLQGRYAKWSDVFPGELPLGNSVDRVQLQSAVRAASVVTSEESRGVTFAFCNGTLTLKAKSSEGGESEVKCDVADFQCDAQVTLAPKYVLEFLKPFDKEFDPCVSIHVCESDGRTVLEVGTEYRGVIMPLAKD